MKARPAVSGGSPVARHRGRRRAQGLLRIELAARSDDAPLLRALAAALLDPQRAAAMRAVLWTRVAPAPGRDLKALLESAPLEGIDLERSTDQGRDIEF